MNTKLDELKNRIKGKVIAAADHQYENVRRSLCWNQLTPERYPQIVARVANEQDVVEAVRFARANKMRISVRGGGHSWVGFSLRDKSLLIDLSNLKQISIDQVGRYAMIQPGVTGRLLNNELKEHDLAFPVGHCPSVPVSGFLLSGGLGWNSINWGPACFSVEAANIVLADGNLVKANHQEYADLFWAVRGGGPGFFGVVTQYFIKLYAAPRAITMSSYLYPLKELEDVGAWVGRIASQLPTEVELTLFIAPAPPHLSERSKSENGFVGILGAVAFMDDEDEAAKTLSLLDRCPTIDQCIGKEINQRTSFDGLLNLGSMLWPEHHRYVVDTLWSNSSPMQSLVIVRDNFLQAPSKKSLCVSVFPTGSETPMLPDAAFSMAGSSLFLCYAIWERQHDDALNIAWHRKMIDALEPLALGHYVGESDIVSKPTRAERSFAPANWKRFQSLRQKYDPDGVFLGHFTE